MDENELARRLYVPNFDYWRRQCRTNYFSARELKVRSIENGIIVPPAPEGDQFEGGVFDRELKFFAGCNNLYADQRDQTFSLELDRSKIERSDEEVIFGGGLTCHFGHFVSESLSRMWYPLTQPTGRKKFAFINLFHWKISRWVYKLFDLLGLAEDRIVFVEKPTQFRSIIVPDQAAFIKENFTREFMLPYRKIASRIRPTFDAKKIFLTRSPELRTKNYVANLKYFEEFFRARGFEIVAPERLSITDQLSLIVGADEIATLLGSLSHWNLFCRAEVKFTMLTRFDQFRCRQCLINQATGSDWYIVSTARNFLYAEQGAGVNLIGPTEHWREYVREHFGEKLSSENRIAPEAIDDYIRHWCKYFSQAEHLQKRIDSLKSVYARGSLFEAQINVARSLLCFETHIARKGWLPSSVEGEINGAPDQKLSLQAIRIYFLKSARKVFYSVYYPNEGWTPIVENKKIAGSVGKNKAIFGIKIFFDRNERRVSYRVHDFDGNWSEWGSDGAEVVSSAPLDAVEIKTERA